MSKSLSFKHANIIELLGIESLPLEVRQKIVEQAVDLVETRTLNRLLESLGGEEEVDNFSKLLEAEDEIRVDEFLAERNIDVLAITEEETEKVKQELFAEINSDENLF